MIEKTDITPPQQPETSASDSAVIKELRDSITESYSVEAVEDGLANYATRVYGALRREGKTTAEAEAIIKGIESGDEQALEEKMRIDDVLHSIDTKRETSKEQKETDRQKGIHRARTLLKMDGQYIESLEDPEEYLYHGVTSSGGEFANNTIRTIAKEGLKDLANTAGNRLSFWRGTQKHHQAPELIDFQGFGHGGAFLRIKSQTLSEQGFELVGSEQADSSATFALKDKAVIPPADLEIWDPKAELWRPLLSYVEELDQQPPN